MDEGIAGAVEGWDQRPFDGGLRQLHELLDRSFSGAIEVGGTWLLAINGRAVGAYEEYDGPDGPEQEPGDVDRLAEVPGTVYEAPHEAVPLLIAMRLAGGEERGRYYTGERALGETRRELEDGGFTGYLELSEEVVSGDYYVVYQGGRSMAVAFTGGEGRLRTGETALERADEEVGIYAVRAVDLDVVELPEPADPAEADGAAGTTGAVEPSAGDGDPPDEPAASTPGGDEGPAADDDAGSASPALEGTDPGSPSTDDAPSGPRDGSADAVDAPPDGDGLEPVSDPGDAAPPSSPGDGRGHETDQSTVEAADAPATAGSTADVARLEARIDALAAEQERLVAAVEDLRDGGATVPDDRTGASAEEGTALDPGGALDDATVLVRYRSDGSTTLDGLESGEVSRETLRENLHLEVSTPFNPDEATIDGRPFRTFLEETLEYRFVEWLVAELPFDLREAGVESRLDRLYESLPAVDRVTVGETASAGGEAFDLVASSRAGDPLVVARFDEGVEPPSEATTEAFVKAATGAAESEPSIAAAVLVTSAYVDGQALGPTREATRGRLLGRNRRASYVRHAGGGYHLCLVEAGESFHLAVPEL